MKKIHSVALLCVLIASFPSLAQKKIKEGIVKFEIKADENASPEMAMMAGTTMDFYFTEKTQKMDINMLGGMIRTQVIIPAAKPSDGTILMDMMGMKYQLTELSEGDGGEAMKGMDMLKIDDISKVEYDKKDTKKIAGYDCYKASVTMKDGSKAKYYITEKIQAPLGLKNNGTTQLNGYPLEIGIDMQGMSITFVAKEVLNKVPDNSFDIPSGYTKKTMKEFGEEIGEMTKGMNSQD